MCNLSKLKVRLFGGGEILGGKEGCVTTQHYLAATLKRRPPRITNIKSSEKNFTFTSLFTKEKDIIPHIHLWEVGRKLGQHCKPKEFGLTS